MNKLVRHFLGHDWLRGPVASLKVVHVERWRSLQSTTWNLMICAIGKSDFADHSLRKSHGVKLKLVIGFNTGWCISRFDRQPLNSFRVILVDGLGDHRNGLLIE